MRNVIIEKDINFMKYRVMKEEENGRVSIIACIWRDKLQSYEEVERVSYDVRDEYESSFLNWENLIFCSDSWGNGKGVRIAVDNDYMLSAVQNGKKTCATLYLSANEKEGKELIASLPCDCAAMPYGDRMIYVYHRGKLSDFFDFDRIKAIYVRNGKTSIDWDRVYYLFNLPLEYFGDKQICGFSLQNAARGEELLITGLILGYPVESTVNWRF